MHRKLSCLVGRHRWRKLHNDAGQMYRECRVCHKQDDPGSRITTWVSSF